jgi:hypothetical protein
VSAKAHPTAGSVQPQCGATVVIFTPTKRLQNLHDVGNNCGAVCVELLLVAVVALKLVVEPNLTLAYEHGRTGRDANSTANDSAPAPCTVSSVLGPVPFGKSAGAIRPALSRLRMKSPALAGADAFIASITQVPQEPLRCDVLRRRERRF